MTEPKPPGELLQGRDETTPVRALARVALVVGAVAVLLIAAAYAVWTSLR